MTNLAKNMQNSMILGNKKNAKKNSKMTYFSVKFFRIAAM